MNKQDILEQIRLDIRLQRKELGLTIKTLAELTKSTRSNITNFENGKANITVDLLARICEALNVRLLIN